MGLDNLPDIVTPKQLAEFLQITDQTAKKAITTGKLKAFKAGRDWRIEKEAVIEWLEQDKAAYVHRNKEEEKQSGGAFIHVELLNGKSGFISQEDGTAFFFVKEGLSKVNIDELIKEQSDKMQYNVAIIDYSRNSGDIKQTLAEKWAKIHGWKTYQLTEDHEGNLCVENSDTGKVLSLGKINHHIINAKGVPNE